MTGLAALMAKLTRWTCLLAVLALPASKAMAHIFVTTSMTAAVLCITHQNITSSTMPVLVTLTLTMVTKAMTMAVCGTTWYVMNAENC
jgi:hypothetical protein